MNPNKLLIYLFFLFPGFVWCILILLAPYLTNSGHTLSADLLYTTFSLTCHQLPERSFSLFGFKFAVCARCTGIYFGALLTTLFYPFILEIDNKKTPNKYLLLLSLIPIGLDGGIQLITNYESNNILRLLTGLFFGCVIPLYVLPTYNEIVYGFLNRKIK